MYNLINAHANLIAGGITPNTIARYNWLLAELHKRNVANDLAYQKKYRGFWKMRFPTASYCSAYFKLLEANKSNGSFPPQTISTSLQKISGKLEFSFATKMAHMVNQRTPIYDNMVSQFFFVPRPSSDLTAYLNIHGFLVTEYQRILSNGLLASAITTFRTVHPNAAHHSNEKVIDWLMWEFVKLANGGAFRQRQFLHI